MSKRPVNLWMIATAALSLGIFITVIVVLYYGIPDQAINMLGALFSIIVMIVVVSVSLIFYFLPSIIAFDRRHHNKVAILLFNLILGPTGLGWVLALVWSAAAIYPPWLLPCRNCGFGNAPGVPVCALCKKHPAIRQ